MALPENIIPGELNLTIYQGATFSRTISLTDTGGNPITITGCTGAAKIRRAFGDTSEVVEFTVVVGTTSVTISLTSAQTAALSSTDTRNRTIPYGYWDLELTSNGRTERVHEGIITLSLEATK